MTCANVLVGLGENREGMETGDAGWEGGDVAICVAPRRERRYGQHTTILDVAISIYAPAKGATQENRRGNPPAAISIHAPVPRGISPCMNCSVPNMPAKKTTLNYSKLLKISVKSHRFYWLDLYKTGKTARKQNSYNSEVDTGDWLCYSITNKSSRESEGSEQNVHRKRTNVGSNVYEHAVLCSDAA